ncbi:ABC transporter substrate-binding protein [Halomicrobium sp. LC1Hm]|uniref:ABC transporter substrate-binding protein n=1 Tax=Halomicrobium sp. LC1Hm TaxID=2610902 RepID=UPI00129851BC|nr:ABC transporter substrate-binding protein [Halomicrobium sp. LC1Hm]QGA83646.1 ABC-type transport system, periplasmic component [Halomicrobium sp. LC1Hm]
MANNHTDHEHQSILSRRRFVSGVSLAGIAGLAGCGGQQAQQTATEASGDGGDETDADPTDSETATEVQATSEAQRKIQELAYITNQTLPVLPVMEKLAQSFQSTDDWNVPGADSDAVQTYWPTEWLPREGQWTATDDSDDDRLTFAQWAVPQDSQYNPWNGQNYGEARRLMFDRFMKYNLATQEYTGYAIQDWEVGEETVSLTVREGLTWHNGDDVTATDVANQVKLDIYNGGSLGNFVAPEDMGAVSDRVTTVDESTVEITLAEPASETILLAYLQPKRLTAHDDSYGEFVTALDEAADEDERASALSDLTNDTTPEPVGCGPFQFEDADSQRTLVSKYEDHPDADNINVPEAEYLYKPQNQGRWNSLINNETDGSATLFMPQNRLNQLPDSMQVSLIPRHWGMGLMFNFEEEPVDDVRVRKAIAHVVNRENAALNSGAGTKSKLAVTYPSGLTGEFNNQIEGGWLEGVVDEFETYGPGESQTEAAASLLRDAGYEKQNGTWQKDGEPLELPIKGPSGFSDWVTGVETIVSNLKDFGIKAESIMLDNSTYWGSDYSNGDFVVGLQGWASYDHSYPYFHFDWIFNSWDAKNAWNLPGEFESPILHDEERDSETVTPVDIVDELSTANQ